MRHSGMSALGQKRTLLRSLDHIVGEGEQSIWNSEPERFCSPEIDHEFELSRLFNGQVGRICAPED